MKLSGLRIDQDQPQVFHPLAHAEEIARTNNQNDEDGWTYTVLEYPYPFPAEFPFGAEHKCRARVEVRDESGELVGYL